MPEFLARRSRTDAPWAATLLTAGMAVRFLLIGTPVWLIAAANPTYLKEAFTRMEVALEEGAPAHAVLIFDEGGREAFRYVGDQPLPDLDEIPRALARMTTAAASGGE